LALRPAPANLTAESIRSVATFREHMEKAGWVQISLPRVVGVPHHVYVADSVHTPHATPLMAPMVPIVPVVPEGWGPVPAGPAIAGQGGEQLAHATRSTVECMLVPDDWVVSMNKTIGPYIGRLHRRLIMRLVQRTHIEVMKQVLYGNALIIFHAYLADTEKEPQVEAHSRMYGVPSMMWVPISSTIKEYVSHTAENNHAAAKKDTERVMGELRTLGHKNFRLYGEGSSSQSQVWISLSPHVLGDAGPVMVQLVRVLDAGAPLREALTAVLETH